ncbi:MAG TPA: hypothetical protein VEL07_17960 [Planctomycetota bacterium]|nr:hypothetical protein [Planctomycetota bacterium]
MKTTKQTTVVAPIETPLRFLDLIDWEELTGASRLRIGPRHAIETMGRLAAMLQPPLAMVYVLLEARGGHAVGRYRSPPIATHAELQRVLDGFRRFFEGDARHHLWIVPTQGTASLVLDRHGMLFAYGDLPAYERKLAMHNFTKGRVHVPRNHSHCFDPAMNEFEAELLELWPWQRSPLRDGDAD